MIDDGPRPFRPSSIGRHSTPPSARDAARTSRIHHLEALPARRVTRAVRSSRTRPPGPLIAALAAALLLGIAAPALAQGTFVNWESPPVHPVDMTPDGSTLLVVNTADARLEIFTLGSGLPVHTASVPVGLDPVSVRARTKLGFAIFEISDNGRGIDPKDHQRIFDLFRRAGTQDKPGQGIGLAHVRALVRRLGGTMSVASELHQGSTFTITLPINWTSTNRNRQT